MSLVEFIKQAIRQQTNLIGVPVRNLYGAVAGQSPAVLNQQTAVWMVASVPATALPSIDQFYNLFASGSAVTNTTLQAVNGIVGITGNYSSGSSPTATLFRGLVEFPGPTVIPIGIVANGPTNEFAVYLDGILQRSGNTSLNQTLAVSAGRHLLEIVTLATEIYIAVPASLRVFTDSDVLQAPVWSSLTTGYVDPILGNIGNTLVWYNDVRAGGWIVSRRTLTYLAEITAMSPVGYGGGYSVEITGDVTGQVTVGDELVSGNNTIGTILGSSYDSTTTVTTVNLQLPSYYIDTDPLWLNRTAAVGRFVEQARRSRIGAVGQITWIDSNVAVGTSYEYQLNSYGFFDPSQLSPPSLIEEITAGDNAAPASITFVTGYPQVFDDVVTVRFTTPADLDYDGVQVQYYDNPLSGTSSGSNTTSTLNDTTLSMVTNQWAGYYLFITSGTGAGQTGLVISNTSTQFTLDSTTLWDSSYIPDATSTYELYQLTTILTDYGFTSTVDQFRFTAPGEGLYYFLTFDRGSNIQDRFSCASWTYDKADALTVPVTNVSVTNVGQNGQISNGTLGMTLFSIPKQEELLLETFTGPTGYLLTGTLLTSGTSDSSGNSTTTLKKTSAGWGTNAYAGKKLRLTPNSGIFSGVILRIVSNTTDTLTFSPALSLAPDSVTFEVLENFPNIVDPTVLDTAGDRWTVNASHGIVQNDALWYKGTGAAEYTIYLDSAYSGTTAQTAADGGNSQLGTSVRLEASLRRATVNASGSNLTYRGNSTNANRWEYGIKHVDNTTVTPRYRYFSGGAGAWTNLPNITWNIFDTNKLIVEIDNDTHTFKIADAYGHNERVLGRVVNTAGPLQTRVGWSVYGQSGGDNIDDFRMLDYSKLVRLKYRLLPNHQNLMVTQYSGTATGGAKLFVTDTNQTWYTNELAGKRILITSGASKGDDRKIVSNTTSQIIVDSIFTSGSISGSTYIVYEPNYTGTESIQFWEARDPINPQVLEFHGERSGVPIEAVKRLRVDANQVPELALTVAKVATVGSNSQVTCTIQPDDDVKTWALFAKLAGWPTTDNTSSGPTDPTYLRWRNEPVSTTSRSMQLADGTWYFVAIPYDSNGTPGPASTATLAVSSGGGSSTGLYLLSANWIGTSNQIKVGWSHTSDIEYSTTTHHVDVTVVDAISGDGFTVASGVRPWDDDGGSNADGKGYVVDTNWVHGVKPIDPYVSLTYTIKLYEDAGGTLVATYYAYIAFYGYSLL